MTDTETLNLFGEKVEKFGKLAKSKGFHKDEIIKPDCILACSEQMEINYGDELKAMDKIIELCEKIDDEEKFIQAVLSLTGIE
ncbi:MAG: hypothetical protein K2N30_04335 [Clostridia bacterium]|nr:hypothetical protein [Clostridia bacterium]